MKREKRIKIALVLVSLLTGFYLVAKLDFRGTLAVEEVAVEQATFQKIVSTRDVYREEFSFDFIIDGYELPLDEESNTFLYSLRENEDLSNPKIKTHSTDSTNYEYVLLDKNITPQTIANGEMVDLLVYNDEYYKQYRIAFTTLPIVKIEMEEPVPEGEYPITMEDRWAQFELYDNRMDVKESERLIKSYTYVRLRGASSLKYPQKQMRLNLRDLSISGEESNQHLSLLDMRKDDDWILYAPYSDPEKMRNTFSTNLWYKTSAKSDSNDINNGTEGKFVEVFIEDRYWGIYTLMHPLDEKQLELEKNKDNPLQSDFYYRMKTNELPQMKIFKKSGNRLTAGSPELRFPDKPLNDYRQWAPLMTHLEMMHTADSGILSEYLETSVNLENQIDYFLFYILAQAHDNDTKNRNYVAYWKEDRHVILESPWDLDLTWGNKWNQSKALNVSVEGKVEENPNLYPSLITRALELGMTDVAEEVVKRYSDLRESIWTEESLLNQLEEYEQDVFGSGAAIRNHKRWPEAAYTEDATALKQFVQERLVQMDQFVYEELQGGALYDGNR